MRIIRLTLVTTAILASFGAMAAAQQQPSAPAPAPTSSPTGVLGDLTGLIDFGFRGDTSTGDEARYERYRDRRSGAFSQIVFGRNTDRYWFDGRAENIGYRDQRYLVNYRDGRFNVAGGWDSIPLNYGYNTSTPWTETSTGVFVLDDAAQLAVQNRTVTGVVGVPTNAAQFNTGSIYRGLATRFELQSRRDTLGANVAYDASESLGINLAFATTKRGGHQPFGMSHAFNNANELPLPLDDRTNDFSAALEWTRPRGMFRIGWDGSWYNNDIQEVVWDNPLRLTDTTPFDSSGYSNGNGAARGRMSVAPSNSSNAISATGMYKGLPWRTTINGTASFTAMNQDDELIPWTTNGAILNPAVFAAYPGLASLPRDTAEAKVHGVNAMVNLTARPNRIFGLNVRYRINDHRNLTPEFDGTYYVRVDAAPSNVGHHTEPFDITENTFDVTGTFNVLPRTSLRFGYTFDAFDRTGRSYSDMTDHMFRTSLDTIGNQYFMVRVGYDFTHRIGSGFSESALEDGGVQPGLRFYDEADRDRSRGSVMLVLTPTELFDVTFQLAAGKDTYKGPGHEFGLLNNSNQSYNTGLTLYPREAITVGVNFGWDKFSALQNARNANPPGTDYGSWFDPNRTWFLDNDETVRNFDIFLDMMRAFRNTDIRFGYTFSDSDQEFDLNGPRIEELSTNRALTPGAPSPCAAGLSSCFEPLPVVPNSWHRLTADVKYFFTQQVGVGFGYWFEKFEITDFNTINMPGDPDTPRIDYLGGLGTGYGNRDFTGNTAFVRLLYAF